MNLFDKKIALGTLLLAISSVSFADNIIHSPRLYGALEYQIGGGYTGTAPTQVHTVPILDLGVGWDLGMDCGNFDPKISVSNQLNGITDGFRNMMGNIIQSATGAVASLPALAIQKANPALYDMLQQGILQGKMDFEWAETSCDEMASVMMNEDSFPFEKYKLAIKTNNWAEQIGLSGGDAIAAKKAVDSINHGNIGADWICGTKKGGNGQPAINALEDIVLVGYNILFDRANSCTTAGMPSSPNSPLYAYWTSPIAASNWAKEVLGSTKLRTCDGCTKLTAEPGKGLMYKHSDITEDLYRRIEDIVDGTTPMTWQNLNLISAPPGVEMNQTIILAIRKRTTSGQEKMIERLSSEIAYARIIEQGRLLTQLIRSGVKEPNVSNQEFAIIIADEAVNQLEVELDQLDREMNTRKTIARETILKIIGIEEQRVQAARNDVTGKTSGTNSWGAP